MARVTLYMRDGCPFCERMRARLEAERGRLEVVNLSRTPQALTEFLKLTGGRSVVPVVVRGTKIEVAPEGGSPVEASGTRVSRERE